MLAGLSPAQFMRKHWQSSPLLVRQAFPGITSPLRRVALFDLASSADVESRVVSRDGSQWSVRHGPFSRRALPPAGRPNWTLLVQGLETHLDAAHELLSRFRFLPDARLDDLMLSWASAGGGVGPHLDSYDVFLLQLQGQRRWRIGRATDETFVEGLPLRILKHFKPEAQWVLKPGDMLYLPPRWAHDGVAVAGDCMTCSIGFRAPAAGALASELLTRLGEDAAADDLTMFRDAGQAATAHPGAVPPRLQRFARQAVVRALRRPADLERALGETLTEPKPKVWFVAAPRADLSAGVQLSPATRMLYDARHVYVNGESFLARGADARRMQVLADTQCLSAQDCLALSPSARKLLLQWLGDGWLMMGRR